LQTILPEKGFKKCLPAAPFSPQREGADVHGLVTKSGADAAIVKKVK
jgi:hypothetical protein